MSLADEIKSLCDLPPPAVFAIERHASRRGRSWVIDFVVLRSEPELRISRLRRLAAHAGFPRCDDGNVVRARQVPEGYEGQEHLVMWERMLPVIAARCGDDARVAGGWRTIKPTWL